MSSNDWAAVGQMGAFVVAIAALVVAIVFRNGTKASRAELRQAKDQAARSAAAAEASAQAAAEAVAEARRLNEIAELELAALSEEREVQLQEEEDPVPRADRVARRRYVARRQARGQDAQG
jgi:hypothetical protein